jgi:hypothetical protein
MITDKAKFYGKGKGEDRKHYFSIMNVCLDNSYKATKEEMAKAKKFGLTDFFELYDDDDIKYYSGYANFELMATMFGAFTILDMAMADSGCTYIKTRNKNGFKMEIV